MDSKHYNKQTNQNLKPILKLNTYEKVQEMSEELNLIMKNKFKNYSNQKLLERLNRRGKNKQNDDDELYEICRRKKEQGFKFISHWDFYEIKEVKK